jgi:hypothetical protein
VVGGDSESVHQEDAGGCRAVKKGMNCVLSRSVKEALSQNWGAYQDNMPMTEARQLEFTDAGEVYQGPNSIAISNMPLPTTTSLPQDYEGKGKAWYATGKEEWRAW